MKRMANNMWKAAGALALVLCGAAARADFADGLSSAAAEGLGDAGVALPGEAASLFVNPAALAGLDQGDASLMYAKPIAGVPDISLQQGVAAVAVPVGSWATLSAGARAFDNAGLSRELEAAAGAGLRLTRRLSVGAAVGLLRREFNVENIPGASSDPVFAEGSSVGGIGVDAGMQYAFSEEVTLGASSRRINRPDLGLSAEDKAPMTWRAGGAFRRGPVTFLGELRGRSEATDADSQWGVGVEWRALGPLALRAGADAEKVSGGMGLSFRDMRLDYAFSFTQDLGAGESGSHKMSIGFRFGAEREAAAKPSKSVSRARKSAPAGVSTKDSRAYPGYTPATRKPVKRKTWVR